MVDPVTLSVLQGRLEQVADEMDATLFSAAFNPIIAEAHDASHGFYDAETGDTLIQGKSGLPIFVGAMSFAVRSVIAWCQNHGAPEPGDVFAFNDPYEGGTHLNDVKLVQPVFSDGALFCYMASVAHWHDVGGNVPGNYNPSATEIFQEGVLIPPIRLVRGGVVQPDVLSLFRANSRLPLSVHGDLNGQLAALKLGHERLDDLLDQYGAELLLEVMAELRKRAAQQMRVLISGLPDGVYRARDYLDNDGIVDSALTVAVAIKIDGERLNLDFSDTSPSCSGPINISRATAEAAVYVALKHVFPDVAGNAGVLDPVSIDIAERSLLDATVPAPVGGYTETILRVIDVIFLALAQAAPERVSGCAYGTINALSIAGQKDDGSRWVMFSFFGGGHGGHIDGDGLSHGNAPISMATIPPVEILESRYPVRFTQWALRDGSGGPGHHRGGLGAVYELEVMSKARGFLFGERGIYAPQGVAGGGSGALNQFRYDGSGETGSLSQKPDMVSKITGIDLAPGQRVRLETPGGGGYGNPESRDVEAVAGDARNGFVSHEDAREIYRVVLNEDHSVNPEATKRLRRQRAA